MKKQLTTAALCLLLFSGGAVALTLSEARSQGRVGETQEGWLAALKTDAETRTFVSEVNRERAASYRQLAESNRLPMEEVAKLAGQKLVARAKPGEYVQGINGRWLKK
ncbi:YdbL family protein [Intestinirhabdus alba]|uniref:DUF1318 domain-containing protein n=1 Tax=Intestinirhabdus alba TaxID=2899544 RepID=A0A6L6INH2_9ENTR|nr:YdbL family protein [Intestinirhabdus alba]MTH48402.1 DUF1318 domain-containing protein [Intestinirhabdus alba]